MFNDSAAMSVSQFLQPTSMTIENAKQMLDIGIERLRIGRCEVDLSRLFAFDSSALAILLEWRRASVSYNNTLLVSGMPEKLSRLASVYGIDKFWF